MKRCYIRESWNSYRREVIPADAPQVQIVESRKAFFAGAVALLGTIMNGLTAGPNSTPQDEQMMLDISSELRDYGTNPQ